MELIQNKGSKKERATQALLIAIAEAKAFDKYIKQERKAINVISKNLEKRCAMNMFKLPLEHGWILTLERLNNYSMFRIPEDRPGLNIMTERISYFCQPEALVIAVCIGSEAVEIVYIQLHSGYLMITCSVDTDESYLSRYAYYALAHRMRYGAYSFEGFHWPDFFNVKTGRSKYLDITINYDIWLKERFFEFYKPGHKLYITLDNSKTPVSRSNEHVVTNLIPRQETGIGYCICYTYLKGGLPFLIPYTLLPAKSGESVKSFIGFIEKKPDFPVQDYSEAQAALNELSFQMRALLPPFTDELNPEMKTEEMQDEDVNNRNTLFLLWQSALPSLVSQKFTHENYWAGRNLKERPAKSKMEACTFSLEIPRLCFSWRDKGEYFELKLRFKVKNKLLRPAVHNPPFFITPLIGPMRLYLLNNLQDYNVLKLFKRYDSGNWETSNGISVLKCHYEGHFKSFKEQLQKYYEFV